MVLEIVFAPLALAQKTFPVGSTIRVTATFKYVAGVNIPVRLKAVPYYTNVTGKHTVDSCAGSADVNLTVASTPTEKTATVDFPLVPLAQGGLEDGTYGLRLWIDGTTATADADNVLVVTGNPEPAPSIWSSLTAMMPMLMMVMMMGMVMPMMQGFGGGEETEGEEAE